METTLRFQDLPIYVGIMTASVVACTGICAAVGAPIFGIVYVVSEYALPKLGYEAIRGIPLTTVSRTAFKASAACFATVGLIVFICHIVESCFGSFECCG